MWLAGQQVCGKGPGGPGGQAQYMRTVCSCWQSQQDAGLHQQGHQHQAGHHPTLLEACQAAPGILYLALVPPI